MRQTVKTYFKIERVISLIFAVIFSMTIIGLILGIPLFKASGRFKRAVDMSDAELIENRSSLFTWGIVIAVLLSPTFIGLVLMLIMVFSTNKYIKNLEEGNMEEANKSFGQTMKEGASKAWDGVKGMWGGAKETFNIKPKLEKQKDQLVELQKMKEEGLISEEDYDAKRKQILGIDK